MGQATNLDSERPGNARTCNRGVAGRRSIMTSPVKIPLSPISIFPKRISKFAPRRRICSRKPDEFGTEMIYGACRNQ
jgi:hypothetical protein